MGVALGKAGDDKRANERMLNRLGWLGERVWLPKLLYDAVPYFYLFCGTCAFLATLYIAEWFWLLPHYLLFSFGCVHMGIVIYRRRSKPKTRVSDRQRL
ncbi:MAG: hypothetical protein KJN77_06390 [Gammaproteobacteria bacterium]|nr:hypothetical protein [Gammaproteobacteria bacterium]